MNDTIILPEAISAAAQGAIVVDRSNLGMLKFTGATRLDLIHRMSTQHVKDLISGRPPYSPVTLPASLTASSSMPLVMLFIV